MGRRLNTFCVITAIYTLFFVIRLMYPNSPAFSCLHMRQRHNNRNEPVPFFPPFTQTESMLLFQSPLHKDFSADARNFFTFS